MTTVKFITAKGSDSTDCAPFYLGIPCAYSAIIFAQLSLLREGDVI